MSRFSPTVFVRPRLMLALAFAAMTMSGAPAFADEMRGSESTRSEITRSGPADDTVTLELVEEAWVETDTATVRVGAVMAVESGGFGLARADLETDLASFVDGATWRIVDFGRRGDDAGFERWHVTAEARVPEAEVAALPDKAKKASKPGRALSIAQVDYTPTLAERERTIGQLRTALYARVAAEIEALNAVFPDRRFRVGSIRMAPGFRPGPNTPMLMRSEQMAQAAPMPKGGGLAGAEKAELQAVVTLSASVDEAPHEATEKKRK